jgi:hypothetical protein
MTIPAFKSIADAVHFLRNRKCGYQLAFGTPAGERVLQDLATFCRASDSTFSPDPRVHALYEGRRQVFLRIVQHLGLSAEELLAISQGHSNVIVKENPDA